jgi:hypothetical protein
VVSALRTGFALCIIGVIAVLVAPALIPPIVNQLCDLQRTEGRLGPGILGNILRGEECIEVITAGFLTIFAVPGTLLLQIGSFVVVMAFTNRIAYRKTGRRIKNDWGTNAIDDRGINMDK